MSEHTPGVAMIAQAEVVELEIEECPRLDKCLSVKSLFSRDWASEEQLAVSIRELCETCPEQPTKGNRVSV